MKNLLLSLVFCLISLPINASELLPEEVVFVPKKLLIGSVSLETTIFKPDGVGPFPLVVINHGKSPGNSHMQERYRPINAVRYFLERNYAVLVPMRQGFSKSGGNYLDGACSTLANARNQAEDVEAVIEYAHSQAFIDKEKTIVVGQSHGGWTTLAYGAGNPDKSVKGLVNFAGGLRNEGCVGWQSSLYKAAEDFGGATKIPAIWFYGDNDSYFSRELSDLMFERYKKGNPKSEFIAYGRFGSDSHSLFTARKGREIWEPYLSNFLLSINMPSKVVNPRYIAPPLAGIPPKSSFAKIDEIDKVPFLSEKGRDVYLQFLQKPMPRAFAVSEKGNYGWANGGEDPLQRALNLCENRAKMTCKLYVVDDYVVW